MTKLSVYTGLFLLVLGIAAYLLTSAASVTALIPAFFGVIFIVLGTLGNKNSNMRRHYMHGAMLLALLGLGGTISGLIVLIKSILFAIRMTLPAATLSQSLMAIACIIFLTAGINSFIKARTNK